MGGFLAAAGYLIGAAAALVMAIWALEALKPALLSAIAMLCYTEDG